jgi:hypothetical protein
VPVFFLRFFKPVYFGELPEAAGGQGVPEVPGEAELPWLLPADPDEPALDEPEFDEPALDEPAFGVEVFPGMVPHGEPPGVVPGAVDVFGFTVEGCVLLPGVGELVEFVPGGLLGGVAPVGGATDPVGGFTVPVGGGVAPGACAWPVLPALPDWAAPPDGVAPPAGAVCATTHVPHKRITDRKASFVADIEEGSQLEFFHSTAFLAVFRRSILHSVCWVVRIKPIGQMP